MEAGKVTATENLIVELMEKSKNSSSNDEARRLLGECCKALAMCEVADALKKVASAINEMKR